MWDIAFYILGFAAFASVVLHIKHLLEKGKCSSCGLEKGCKKAFCAGKDKA